MNKRLRKLLDRQAELLARMEAINAAADAEGRDLNEDEAAEYSAAEGELETLATRIERESKLADRRRTAATVPASVMGSGEGEDEDGDEDGDGDEDEGGESEGDNPQARLRTGMALSRFDRGVLAGGLPVHMMHPSRRGRRAYATPRARGRVFRNIGEQLQAVAAATDTSAAGHVRAVNMLTEIREQRAPGMDASGASADVGSDGAWLVQSDFTTDLLDAAEEEAVLLPMTRSVEIGENSDSLEAPFIDETSRADGSRFGGVLVYWAAEGDSVTAKKPKFGKHEIRLEELHGLAYATKRLLRDATALASVFGSAFASEMAFKLDDSIMNGNGAGKPLGLLHSKNAALVAVAKDGSQTADTVTATNVTNVWAAMAARNRRRPSAVWLYNQDIETQLLTLTIEGTSSSTPVFVPPGGFSASPFGTIFGKPAIAIEQAATLGDKGDIGLYDLSEYLTIRKGGLIAEQSMHVRFIQHEQTFRWTLAANGQPTWRSSRTPFKGTQAQSPYVCVAARA